MPELGRAALVVCLGLALYALVAGGYAAATRRPPFGKQAARLRPFLNFRVQSLRPDSTTGAAVAAFCCIASRSSLSNDALPST